MTSTSRNTEFTERAVNAAPDSQTVPLGSYQDVAQIESTSANSQILTDVYKTSNLELFTLDGVLEREYPIGTINWPTTVAYNTMLQKYTFPDTLFNQTYIAAKIQDFRYFRGGMRFTVRVVSNKFTYGKLLVAWFPNTANVPSELTLRDCQILSGIPHILVSAAAGEVGVLDVPFISPSRFLDITSYTNGDMGTLYVMVLNPLTDVNNAVSTSQVFITAQFLEPELAYPISLQSTKLDFRGIFHTQSKVVKKKHVNHEAKQKSESGTISSALEGMSTMASTIDAIAPVVPYAGLFAKAAHGAASLTSMFGLSKPTTTAMTQVLKVNPYCDLNYGKGMDLGPKLSMDPENGISTQPTVGGISTDEMDMKFIVGTPMLVSSQALALHYNTAIPQDISTLDTDTNTYVDIFSRLFRYCSGSYKFKVYITASLFQSIRLVFWLNSSPTATHWENCYHRVVDVQGDTEQEFSIPYLRKQVMRLNDTGADNILWVTVLSWNQPNMAVDTPIYLNIYKAGDTDWQVGCPLDKSYTVQSGKLDFRNCFKTQSNPRLDFGQTFQPLHPGLTCFQHDKLVCGEQFTSIRELFHKYWAYYNTTTTATIDRCFVFNPTYTTLSTVKYKLGIEMLALFYLYWRGSIRIKTVLTSTVPMPISTIYGFQGVNETLPGATVACSTNPIQETEIPFYTNQLFNPTLVANLNPMILSTHTPVLYLCKAAGDDFSCHYMIPGWLIVPGAFQSTSIGQAGFGWGGFFATVT